MKMVLFISVLVLLLTNMLAFSFNLQDFKASGTVYIGVDGSIDPPNTSISTVSNVTYTSKDDVVAEGAGIVGNAGIGESEEVLMGKSEISRHRITPFEVEELKKRVGIWEEGKNYSQKINGHGTGLRPPTEKEWVQIAKDAYVVEKVVLKDVDLSQSSVDLTTMPWFPPIGDQDGEGSCTCWAVGYYMKTFQEAKEHSWDLSEATWSGGQPSVEYQDRIISPDFIYHLINGGVDGGSSSWTAINLICSIGASSWEKMPYNPDDHATWPSEEAWREAPLYRGNSSGWNELYVDTNDGLTSLKNWIALNNLAAIGIDGSKIANMWGSLLTGNDALTLDNYHPPWDYNSWHEVTVVGYDDNFVYSEQGQTHYGAFKIANSWGIGSLLNPWEHIYDGCFWISYEAMKQHVRSCEFYHDRIGYEPELVASFRITHSKRGECSQGFGSITVGVGSQTKSFSDYIVGGDQPFCSNNILFDITEFKDAIPNMYGQQFFLEVYDGGSSATGTITKFAVEYAESTNPPISTINGGSAYAYVTLSPLETNWRTGNQVNSDNDFLDSKVSMATDSNGYLYVAYDDLYSATNQYAVFIRRSIDEGRTWSTIYVASDSTHNVRYPSIAIDPYSNDVFVAVEREWTPNDHDIFVVRRVNGVWSWNAIANVLGSDDRFPSITCEYQYGGGNWQYVSYEYVYTYNDRDLMFAKSIDHGASWSIQKLYGNWPDYNVHAQTSITNAEGYIYIAYKWGADYNSACEIILVRSTDFGNTWTQLMDVDGLPNGCSFPSIAATHGGSTVMIAFQYDWSASDIDIRYSYSTDKGTNWVKGYSLFASGLEDEKLPTLTVDGGGSTGNDVRGYFHIACKVGSYVKYRRAHYSVPYSWDSPITVSERWIGKSIAIATQYRSETAEFHPYVSWNDERTNNIYCSTIGHVHNLNNGLKYESIQEAINANETLSGHTLLAESRTYNEIIFINKSVTLLGENWTDTTIYGKGYNYAVEVSANGSVIDGFTVKNGYPGIGVHSCSNVTIQNNLITDNEIGIALDYGSSSNKILQNNVTLNRWYGIWILGSPDNFLRNNSMTANMYNFGVQGESLSAFIQDIDVSNTIEYKPIVFWTNERGKTVPVNAGYVALINCTQITLENLNLASNGEGLLFAYTTNSSIAKSNITNNECGIRFYNSSSITAFKNALSRNQVGIGLFYSLNNRIIQNNLTANDWGIYLTVSSDNIVIRNDVEGNKDTGVRFWNSSNNSFHHNNFMNNTNQIYDYAWDYPEYYSPSINVWDDGYPSGGNYWSDYNGTDLNTGLDQNVTGSDGIGDTPYTIDENSTDKYPLMRLWASPDIAVLNVTPSKLNVRQGVLIHVNITVMNQGNKIEGFNLTAYANTTSLQTQYFTLVSSNSTTFTYAWNTSGFLEGHYTISAYASPVEGETDTADNLKVDGAVKIDMTPPTIVILSPQNKTYYSDSIPLTFIIDEPTSWIGYSLDNQPNITISGNTVVNVENGLHQIVVYTNDTAGNMGSSYSVHFAVNSSLYDPWKTSFIGLGGYPIVDFAVYDGKLYAAADNTLYVYDGYSWNIINTPTFVVSLEPYQDKLVVGGQGGLYSFDGAAFNLVFTVPTYIKVLGVYNNTLHAGTILDKPPTLYYCNGLVDNPADWHVETDFSAVLSFSGAFGSIDSFGVYDNAMYVGSGGKLYSFNGASWSIAASYDDVYAFLDMQVYNGKLYLATRDQGWRKPMYLGGSGFSGRVIEFDGENWITAFDHDYWIYSLEEYDGKLYAGTANKILTYNGTSWETSFSATEGAYYAISMINYDGKIYAGMGNGYMFADPAPLKAEHETIVVPEFPSTTILAVFTTVTMLAAALTKKNPTKRLD
ncbi:right-handed parallel beta-helix repeat-containing protein [Candidatus Bathyarchaeota archaeon]|nr:right-handed parallel beta-helix repeat-containing protein [Candidatus Bathyarchaeota archaeon]